MLDYKKFRIQQEQNWLPVQDNGRPSGGLTLAVLELCGFEIRKVSRTVMIDCAKHRLRERLLLIPEAIAKTLKAASLNPARFRGHFVDKKSGAEFVAILLSQTRPRLVHKGARPALPAGSFVEINPEFVFVGNGLYCHGKPCLVTETKNGRPSDEEMSKTFVKIRCTNPNSLLVHGQVITQLELLRENLRLESESLAKFGYISAAPFNPDDPERVVPAVLPTKGASNGEPEWVIEERKKLQQPLDEEKF